MEKIQKINKLLRYWILKMTTEAGSGHVTSSLSAVELMSVLMFASGISNNKEIFFRYDLKNPNSVYNDRLIFSKGHASPLFYALWAMAGGINVEELWTFRKFKSRLEGHPTMKFPFTEVPTGSLGQGLSAGLGLALSNRQLLDNDKSKIWVLLGDSEMAEGQVWEAMELASFYKCDNLIAVVDVNRLGQRGETMLGRSADVYAWRARSFGWRAMVIDGHDIDSILSAYKDALEHRNMPTMIVANTIKGKGVSFLEDKDGWHGKTLNREQFQTACDEIGDIDYSVRGELVKPEIENFSSNKVSKTREISSGYDFDELGDVVAPRDGYGKGLWDVMSIDNKIVALDAEVSNSTRSDFVKRDFGDRFFEMFIAEQNMVTTALGFSRNGYRPFVSSFAAFLSRAYDQIRMAQYADLDLVFVGSHAGVSIGFDGSSQMGLDDIAFFRTIFTSSVLAMSDASSTRFMVSQLSKVKGISYLRTIREKLPVIYDKFEEFPIGGSKVLFESSLDKVAILSHGICVHEAIKAYRRLEKIGINIRVIDMYSIKPIDEKRLNSTFASVKNIVIVEDHRREGGLGEAVKSKVCTKDIKIKHLAVDKVPMSGTPDELMSYEEIDSDAIVNAVKEMV